MLSEPNLIKVNLCMTLSRNQNKGEVLHASLSITACPPWTVVEAAGISRQSALFDVFALPPLGDAVAVPLIGLLRTSLCCLPFLERNKK